MQKIKKGNVKEITIALAIFACVMVIIGAITLYAAESSTSADGLFGYYILSDGTVEITKYIGTETEITIPGSIDGKTVTSIEFDASEGNKRLTSIEIPSSVTRMGLWAWSSCNSLINIKVNSNNKKYSSIDGVLYNKNKTEVINYPRGRTDTEYIIPEGVTSIRYCAFTACNLKNIEIPRSVTSIGEYAFEMSSLTSIEIPNGVKSIETTVFYGCKSLTYIKIPESVTSIGSSAFSRCISLKSIEIPEGVISIGAGAFKDCNSLESIKIPNSVTSIGNRAFKDCRSLTSIEIPEELKNMGEDAFYGCEIINAIPSGERIQEIELPEIIKRAMNEEDVLYSSVELSDCTLNNDKTKLVVNVETASKRTVRLRFVDGNLNGLSVVFVVPSGTITYSNTSLTNENVKATLHIAEGETITNNNGDNTYIFKRNGEFAFEYMDVDGNTKTAIAKVTNIDRFFQGETESYYINTAKDFWEFAQEVNNGNTFEGFTVYLMEDIDVGCTVDRQWIPIGACYADTGDYAETTDKDPFGGVFEGNNHTISGVYIDTESNFAGLFGYNQGTIQNLILKDSYIKSTESYIAGITAFNKRKDKKLS